MLWTTNTTSLVILCSSCGWVENAWPRRQVYSSQSTLCDEKLQAVELQNDHTSHEYAE